MWDRYMGETNARSKEALCGKFLVHSSQKRFQGICPLKVKPASAFARRKKKTAPKKPRKPRKNKFIEDSRKPSQRGSKKKNNFKSNRKTSVPAMSSAFLGFMREFRRNNSNMGTLLSLQKGTKEWVKLSKDDQDRYRKEVSLFCSPKTYLKCFPQKPQHRRSHDARCSKDDSQTAALSN